jgi:hypothetical protein
MNYSMNIHDVSQVIVHPPRENALSSSTYETRTIEIVTADGARFELTMFSVHVAKDDDAASMITVHV